LLKRWEDKRGGFCWRPGLGWGPHFLRNQLRSSVILGARARKIAFAGKWGKLKNDHAGSLKNLRKIGDVKRRF